MAKGTTRESTTATTDDNNNNNNNISKQSSNKTHDFCLGTKKSSCPNRKSDRINNCKYNYMATSCLLHDSLALAYKMADMRSSSRVRKQESAKMTLTLPAAKWSLWALSLLAAVTLLLWGQMNFPKTEAIRLQPDGKDKYHWADESFVVTCQNNHHVKNVKVRWFGPNGIEITDDRSQRVHASSSGQSGKSLVFMKAIAPNDDGQYKCQLGAAGDSSHREQTEFNLKLYKLPNFNGTETHLVVPAGNNAVLRCRVEFDPASTYTNVVWFRGSTPIEQLKDSESYQTTEYNQDSRESLLTVNRVRRDHAGTYKCQAHVETPQLPKMSELDIELEVQYEPYFDQPIEKVWVEKGGNAGRLILQQQQQQAGNGAAGTVYSAARPGGGHGSSQLKHRQRPNAYSQWPAEAGQSSADSNGQQTNVTVRVELVCRAYANPPASIIWSASGSSRYELIKGSQPHVVDGPRTELYGHNTTSTLTIEYNLSPKWEHSQDEYMCHASNQLGSATKKMTIEQGDPAPAFNVGPRRHYDPASSMFSLTLLGPRGSPSSANSEAAVGTSPNQLNNVNVNNNININGPPIDSFRIRAEPPGGSSSGDSMSHYNANHNSNHNQKVNAVELQALQFNKQHSISLPQNVTVSLAKLPPGTQKLFLEAHNAVGWSPHYTFLGEYNLVSGSGSNVIPSIGFINLLATCVALVAFINFQTISGLVSQTRVANLARFNQ